ncbi:MAG: AtpZ/AtpI family protein [Patescibacteria group bacterium]|nr:AtpZ/AtpI family protein [Patescibacteria group bacterium]
MEQSNFKVWYAISFAFQLGFLTISVIVGFAWFGLWLDSIFQFGNLFFLLGVFFGMAVAIYEAHSMATFIVQ